MRSITIDGIEIFYEYSEEKEEQFDPNGNPGTPGSIEIEIISPVEFIDNDQIKYEIYEHEKDNS